MSAARNKQLGSTCLLVKEYRASKGCKREVHSVMRGSYSSHYRRMLPKLRIELTVAFTTAATREVVDRREVQRRLLLCLYGLGSNAGLKRLGVGNGVTYKELLHTRRRYIDKESLREATRRVAQATLAVIRSRARIGSGDPAAHLGGRSAI
jgi:Tn3 transposase DDE domain